MNDEATVTIYRCDPPAEPTWEQVGGRWRRLAAVPVPWRTACTDYFIIGIDSAHATACLDFPPLVEPDPFPVIHLFRSAA